ncbi:hypothetical protein DPMN_175069 [Dreissena polymorpha]|uniref:Uncharacterized protein n=1 Tax=Dreissena polymorpha TaxID=45954 RepID=A0A9D4E5S6_DREPO|nr:hypothetical protein DPMN_175069 [Dreissena polymorpha]
MGYHRLHSAGSTRSCIHDTADSTLSSELSSARPMECSVPQGSCLSPWQYLTYTGTIFDVIPPTITVYGFADGHTANKRFRPTSANSESNDIQELV